MPIGFGEDVYCLYFLISFDAMCPFIILNHNLTSMSVGVGFSRGLIGRRCYLHLQYILIVFVFLVLSSLSHEVAAEIIGGPAIQVEDLVLNLVLESLYMSILLQCVASTESTILSLQPFLVHTASAKCCKSSAGRRGRSNTSRETLMTTSKLQLAS